MSTASVEFVVVIYMIYLSGDSVPEDSFYVVSSLPQLFCCLEVLGDSRHTSLSLRGLFPFCWTPRVTLVKPENAIDQENGLLGLHLSLQSCPVDS